MLRRMLAAVAVLGVALVLAVGLQGPVAHEGVRWVPSLDLGGRGPQLTPPAQTQSAPPRPTALQAAHAGWHVSPWVWWAVLAAVVLVVAVAVALWWRRHHGPREPDPGPAVLPGVHDAAQLAAEPEPEPDLPVLRRGFEQAFHVLADERHPHDAIVQAWLGLEEAAQDAGVSRRPAETATELTTRILGRVTTDRDAAQALLDLYLAVRYGGREATVGDVRAARSALEDLTAGWVRTGRRWGA